MRTQLFSSLLVVSFLAGCSSDPLKYRVEEKHIQSLPVDKLQEARTIKEKVDAAKQKWEVAKLQQKLVKADYEAAKRFAEAAEFQLQSVKEKVELQNKGVPMDVAAGALEEATQDLALSKKNLKYRTLLDDLFEKRVKYFFMEYHSLRAQYYESVAMTMVAAGHEQAKDIKKSDFVRQSAERKTLMAETLEAVEKGEAPIKEMGAELKDAWAPRLSCKMDASKCPECKCPECKCPQCNCPKCPESKPAPAPGARPAAGATPPPARDQPRP